jgi:hypothetical protein
MLVIAPEPAVVSRLPTTYNADTTVVGVVLIDDA